MIEMMVIPINKDGNIRLGEENTVEKEGLEGFENVGGGGGRGEEKICDGGNCSILFFLNFLLSVNQQTKITK